MNEGLLPCEVAAKAVILHVGRPVRVVLDVPVLAPLESLAGELVFPDELRGDVLQVLD